MPYKQGGLDFRRYKVFEELKKYGEGAIAPAKGVFFVLNVNGSDPHALKAFRLYAESVKEENGVLSRDMLEFLNGTK